MKTNVHKTHSEPSRLTPTSNWWRRTSLYLTLASALHTHAAVVAPDQPTAGKSTAEWTAACWQWALAIPKDGHHPLQDQTGSDALRNQAGPVYYLGGVMNSTGRATRTIAVPEGISLLVNVLGLECSTLEEVPFHGDNETELRACAESYTFWDLSLELDGESVPDLDRFHVSSPLFNFTVPANNIFDISPPGQGQAVAAGISVMLEALSPGLHRLHFSGRSENGAFADITYLITIFAWPDITIRPLSDAPLTALSWSSPVNLSVQESDRLGLGAVWRLASVVSAETTNGTRIVRVTRPSSNRFYRLTQP